MDAETDKPEPVTVTLSADVRRALAAICAAERRTRRSAIEVSLLAYARRLAREVDDQ